MQAIVFTFACASLCIAASDVPTFIRVPQASIDDRSKPILNFKLANEVGTEKQEGVEANNNVESKGVKDKDQTKLTPKLPEQQQVDISAQHPSLSETAAVNPVRFESATEAKEQLEKLAEAAELLEKLVKAMEATEYGTEAFKAILSGLEGVLGPLGMAFSAVADIIGAIFGSSENAELMKFMKEEFSLVFEQLQAIEQKLNEIGTEIQKEAVYEMYWQAREPIMYVKTAYDGMLSVHDSSAQAAFIHQCIEYSPTDSLTNIHDLITDASYPTHLPSVLAQGFKRAEFKLFTTIIMSDVLRASVLEQSCLGVRKQSAEYMAYRAKQTSAWIGEISTELAKYDSQIANTFYESQLGTDVTGTLGSSNHTDQAIMTYHLLKAKYNWLYWVVIVYDGIDGGQKHGVSAYEGGAYGGKWWWRTSQGNVVVGWSVTAMGETGLATASNYLWSMVEKSVDGSCGKSNWPCVAEAAIQAMTDHKYRTVLVSIVPRGPALSVYGDDGFTYVIEEQVFGGMGSWVDGQSYTAVKSNRINSASTVPLLPGKVFLHQQSKANILQSMRK